MSEEFQRHLFENFSRESTSTVSRQEGAGLGLAIVKKIIDLSGGTISVKSIKDEGSEFTVEFPVKVMDENSEKAYKEDADRYIQPDETKYSFKGKKNLLVEDNEMNREIALDMLTEAGIDTETAEDGSVAVKKLKEKGPYYYDFILMDIQMPVMNGYEATKEIRKMYPDVSIPIIALSANAFDEDKTASIAAGMDDHVAKHVKIEELFRIAARFL